MVDKEQSETVEGETRAVIERYAWRRQHIDPWRYHPLNPSVYMAAQERERAMIRLIEYAGLQPTEDKRVLEVGCGAGGNLLQLLRLGFRPDNLVGNELLPERVAAASAVLPGGGKILAGDAMALALPAEHFDMVTQFTVFTSLLDDEYQARLAERMWSLVKPGGGVVWYDFCFDNPRNQHVRAVPLRRVKALFPQGVVKAWRVTLAPPVSRFVTRVHPHLYTLFNMVPWLRTHLLCWIEKPR